MTKRAALMLALACLIFVSLPVFAALRSGGGPTCRLHASVVIWTANDWKLLAGELAARTNACADYYLSIPPAAADKTRLRAGQDDVIRRFGSRFKPVAELTLGGETGWAAWVAADPPRTWHQAGVEFRRRMLKAGYDTWLLNEADRSTRRDEAPYPRQAIRDVVRGVARGDATGPVIPGIVELGIQYSHQTMPDLTGFKTETESLLADGAFWNDIGPNVVFFAREAYVDARRWGVAGTSLADRARHIDDFQMQLERLAADGPASVEPARRVLGRTFLPLMNATWPSPGPDPYLPPFCCGHGWTMIPLQQMLALVSEEVHAVRNTSDALASPARLGFSWQPKDNFNLGRPAFEAGMRAIAGRIGASVRDAYAPGGSARAACGTTQDFCMGGNVPGAHFTEAWAGIADWHG